MDPKFRTSFIPKKNVGTPSVRPKKSYKSFSLLSFVGVVVFLVAIIVSGGLFGYQYTLIQSIDQKGNALAEARRSIDDNYINSLKSIDERLITANQLLDKHVVLSSFFEFLEKFTLKSVQFTSLKYEIDEDGQMSVEIGGKSLSYNSLVLQSNILENNNILENSELSDVKLDDSGNVIFKIKSVLDSSFLKFKDNNIQS